MCGIAGIIRIHDPSAGPPPPHLESIPEAWLDTLDDSIKHRGPDGAARFRDRATRPDGTTIDVALVHRRLSILDHAGGHQPMVHDGHRLRPDLTYQPGEPPRLAHELEPHKPLVAIAFNGCIYNHRDLRKELQAKGHVFETDHSDTEVLVHGWREWELQIVDHLDGMSASLIWDRATGQLSIGRDLAGEKPLYDGPLHLSNTRGIVLTSSAAGYARFSQLTECRERCKQISSYVDLWTTHGSDSSPASMVNSVWPGAWSVLPTPPNRRGSSDGASFHTPVLERSQLQHHVSTKPIRRLAGNHDDLTNASLPHFLTASVISRLESDAPLGLFLSGGLDSALIAAIAKQHRPDIKTFTVRMPPTTSGASLDESEAAAETARHLGTDHHTLDCNPDPASDLIHLIHQLGLPFGDSSLLPTYWVSKAARQHVKVALSGDGGDELFGGYRRHTIAPTLNRYRHLLRLIPTRLLNQRTPGSRSDYLARLATAARTGGYTELLAIFQTPDLRKLITQSDDDHVGHSTFQKITDPLRYDFDHYLPDDLLRKTDTASMAVALEVRAPFLARELVEAALRTPLNVLMPNGQRKGLLKQVARNYLPDHIINRPKQGFAIPVGKWFRSDFGSMRSLLHDHLRSADPFPGLDEAGVHINMDFVRTMLRQHDAAGEKSLNPWLGRDHSQRLYMLLVLSIWSKWLKSLHA